MKEPPVRVSLSTFKKWIKEFQGGRLRRRRFDDIELYDLVLLTQGEAGAAYQGKVARISDLKLKIGEEEARPRVRSAITARGELNKVNRNTVAHQHQPEPAPGNHPFD